METFKIDINEGGRGELVLLVDDQQAGKMDIAIRDGLLTVYHTEVDEIHAGKGYAKLLLGELVRIARDRDLTIKPLCPFVHGQFKKHPETYEDIWRKGV